MFTLDNYEVSFDYNQQYRITIYDVPIIIKGITLCHINGEGGRYFGASVCSPDDKDRRSVGRKESLARALKPLNKETRTRFWQKYFEVLGGVK